MPDGSSGAVAPSLEIAQEFWSLLSPGDPVLRLRFLHHDRSNTPAERESTLEQLWPEVVELQGRGYDVYYFVNQMNPGAGSGAGGCATDQDVAGIRGHAADFDKGLPDTWHLEPSIIVRTSRVRGGDKEIQKGQGFGWLTAARLSNSERGRSGSPAITAPIRPSRTRRGCCACRAPCT